MIGVIIPRDESLRVQARGHELYEEEGFGKSQQRKPQRHSERQCTYVQLLESLLCLTSYIESVNTILAAFETPS